MLHQTFEPHDLILIAFLVVLEGVLSIDNALVLGLLARRVPKYLRPRACRMDWWGRWSFVSSRLSRPAICFSGDFQNCSAGST